MIHIALSIAAFMFIGYLILGAIGIVGAVAEEKGWCCGCIAGIVLLIIFLTLI